MSRISIPFSASDISALARSLREQLENRESAPSHVEMLNILARSTGHRNFQSLRAQLMAQSQLEQPPAEAEPVDYVQVRQLARFFDSKGSLVSWPAKTSLQVVCLWVLWSKLPAHEALAEDELNRQLRAAHRFGDHALLRRELCDRGMVTRSADGREYRRVEQKPPAEAVALIRVIAGRSK